MSKSYPPHKSLSKKLSTVKKEAHYQDTQAMPNSGAFSNAYGFSKANHSQNTHVCAELFCTYKPQLSYKTTHKGILEDSDNPVPPSPTVPPIGGTLQKNCASRKLLWGKVCEYPHWETTRPHASSACGLYSICHQ